MGCFFLALSIRPKSPGHIAQNVRPAVVSASPRLHPQDAIGLSRRQASEFTRSPPPARAGTSLHEHQACAAAIVRVDAGGSRADVVYGRLRWGSEALVRHGGGSLNQGIERELIGHVNPLLLAGVARLATVIATIDSACGPPALSLGNGFSAAHVVTEINLVLGAGHVLATS